MDWENKKQTSKEYNKRKQRLAKNKKYEEAIDKLQNEIEDIDSEIDRLLQKKKSKQEEINDISSEKCNDFMRIYNNKELFAEIINNVRKTTFSRRIISEIEEQYKTGVNSDNATMESIETILSMDKIIYEEVPHTNCFSDLLNDFGSVIDFLDKEDDANGN